MEFNNIQLPAITIVALFKHSLVLIDGEKIGNGQFTIGTALLPKFDTPIPISFEPKTTAEQTETDDLQTDKLKITTTDLNTAVKNILITTKNNHAEAATTSNNQAERLQPVNKIKYLGGFGKKISIVLADHFHPHINDNDLAFLTKLLQACQLSLNDVAIINVASNGNYSNVLWQLMPAEKMIIFEIDPGTLGLPFRLSHFKLQPWADCVFLAAPSLEALQAGASENVIQLKRSLWESLKKMFLS